MASIASRFAVFSSPIAVHFVEWSAAFNSPYRTELRRQNRQSISRSSRLHFVWRVAHRCPTKYFVDSNFESNRYAGEEGSADLVWASVERQESAKSFRKKPAVSFLSRSHIQESNFQKK